MKHVFVRDYLVEVSFREKEGGPVKLETRKVRSFNKAGAERLVKTAIKAERRLLVKVVRVLCSKDK